MAIKKRYMFAKAGDYLIPADEESQEFLDNMFVGETATFSHIHERDLKRLNAYHSFLNYVYDYLPDRFKMAVKKKNFYKVLKSLVGEDNVIIEFKDGTKLVEYQSISFENMSEEEFRKYIKSQLPYIYSDILGHYYSGQQLTDIIETIEKDYESFFKGLN